MENKFLRLADLSLGMFVMNVNKNVYQVISFETGKAVLKNQETFLDVKLDYKLVDENQLIECDKNGNFRNNNMQEKQKQQLVSIDHPEGAAILISPQMTGRLALVDLQTLKRITSGMTRASFIHIKETFIEQLKNCNELTDYVAILKDEVNFHECVNLINTIEVNQ